MTEQHNILMPEVVQGIKAAGLEAIKQARRMGTKLVVWRDGKIAEITPDEADAMVKEREEQKAR